MGGLFDVNSKKNRILELKSLMEAPGFWDDFDNSQNKSIEYNKLKEVINDYESLLDNAKFYLENFQEFHPEEIQEFIQEFTLKINDLEKNTYLNGEYDNLNCYLEIHPGAGGTESCDWASMLKRMYERFCEKYDYSCDIIEEQDGEEAGIKSVTMLIKGNSPYGYLKRENGVHRLVRISPFDSNKRRHTSFASVTITPEFDNSIDVPLNENDLKIDVYHSSGAGGQSVNTTNSAVRITHLPTKTVVTCQNERSQLKNKETALRILKSKLYELELMKNEEKIKSLKGADININFGSQIRSYVLEPYKLVKDNRSNYESPEPDKILNGEIVELLNYNLKNIK